MGPLGSILFPLGFFLVLVGVVLISRSPFMKEILEQSEFLQKHRKSMGAILALVGIALMVAVIASGA